MKSYVYILILSLLLITKPTATGAIECTENFKPVACSSNSDCCRGCCINNICTSSSKQCNSDENPCTYHQCPAGQACFLQQVQCIRAPCPKIPTCRPIKSD